MKQPRPTVRVDYNWPDEDGTLVVAVLIRNLDCEVWVRSFTRRNYSKAVEYANRVKKALAGRKE